MRISDWSSDVCSSDLRVRIGRITPDALGVGERPQRRPVARDHHGARIARLGQLRREGEIEKQQRQQERDRAPAQPGEESAPAATRISLPVHDVVDTHARSEEHTSELQSLMRISYAVFCLKKNTNDQKNSQLSNTPRN